MCRDGLQQGQQVNIFSLSSRVELSCLNKNRSCAPASKTIVLVFEAQKLPVCVSFKDKCCCVSNTKVARVRQALGAV